MTIANIKYYRDLPFEDYLAMPGTSFSSLKGEIPASEGMKLGTRVHNYLNEPASYDWQQVEIVKPIAAALRSYLGDAFKFLEKEVAFTCDMIHNGMLLKYKGRADGLKIGRIVIDFKVLAGSLEAACNQFDYPHQLSGYGLGTGSPLGLIIAFNKSAKKVETKTIRTVAAFWEYQTVRLGKPL